jgi:hypothetical protein
MAEEDGAVGDFLRIDEALGDTIQCRPGRQRVHVVSPTYDLSILDRDDRNEPVVIARPVGEDASVYFVFKDDHATIPSPVNNKCIGGVKLDRFAVSREAGHQIGSSSDRRGPTRKVIAGFEDYVIGERVEIVFAINQPVQASEDDLEERI